MQLNPVLNRLMAEGKAFLGCEYPIICGAMTWVSEPKLVSAVCNAGAFACLAGGNTPVDILRRQIEETRDLTPRNFAVNLITIAPSYQDQLKMVAAMAHPYVVFAGGIPKANEVSMVKEKGAKVICFAPATALAERLVKNGADALVIEGSEAGGHIGAVSGMVLLQEVLFSMAGRLPIFYGGGIATGRMLAHILLMGATGVQLGTKFVMTDECVAHAEFKKAFSRAAARDAITTPQLDQRLPVATVRCLKNEAIDDFAKLQLKLMGDLDAGLTTTKVAQEDLERFWIGGLRKAVMEGDVKRGSVMAGQSVGLVKDVKPVKEVIAELLGDASKEIDRVRALLMA